MGKKKAPIFRNGANKSNSETSGDNDKIAAIRTWNDVEHDSEDEFFEDREKVLLNDADDNDEDESDREVYGLEGIGSESEEGSDDEDKAEFETEDKTWGTSKQAYYDADEGEDLDEMREEEEEALRIQKEHLAQMEEADFMDDWGAGAAAGDDEQDEKKLVEDVSKELDDISFDKAKIEKRRKNLPVTEKLKIIQNESPELIDLLDEFKENTRSINSLRPIVEKIQENSEKREKKAAQFLLFKYEMLLNYMTNISFYFALKASVQSANEVQYHPVIQALYQFRQTHEKLVEIEDKMQEEIEDFINNIDKEESYGDSEEPHSKEEMKLPQKQHLDQAYSDKESAQDLSGSDEESEDEQKILSDIRDIEEEFKSLKKSLASKKRKRTALATEYNDFEEMDSINDVDLEDKLAKKRSLRFYTAKIDAKQYKNVNKYQGDIDIPYKERNNKNQQKGVAQPEDASADLDDAEYDEEDIAAADEVRNGVQDSDDEFYESIVADKQATKRAKREQYEAERPEIESRDIEVDDGQKRLASYKILKNKGLTPHRKKENRNARVKHRNKYAKKLKKLSSTRAVHKMPTATYGGEMSGVKTNVIKSVKLSQ
ncbi:Sas10 C-terminal domain-containing protein [Mycotypha africana]|uniref:Sas10 C-terminal domain-containing protein n=1 Tax=Mycotypha africana TaxID=64632 RepID=UPI0023000EC5|nr:Sas10 C-terminal domain-containing protein [Mycotypha africana]KAI8987937.1 Sas10 C-terminal domain-containing protein [Mycotypha africana]